MIRGDFVSVLPVPRCLRPSSLTLLDPSAPSVLQPRPSYIVSSRLPSERPTRISSDHVFRSSSSRAYTFAIISIVLFVLVAAFLRQSAFPLVVSSSRSLTSSRFSCSSVLARAGHPTLHQLPPSRRRGRFSFLSPRRLQRSRRRTCVQSRPLRCLRRDRLRVSRLSRRVDSSTKLTTPLDNNDAASRRSSCRNATHWYGSCPQHQVCSPPATSHHPPLILLTSR